MAKRQALLGNQFPAYSPEDFKPGRGRQAEVSSLDAVIVFDYKPGAESDLKKRFGSEEKDREMFRFKEVE